MQIKLVEGDSAGTVTAFYVSVYIYIYVYFTIILSLSIFIHMQ